MEDSQDSTKTEALVPADAKLELVKNNSGTGMVQRARNANGKFVATSTVSAQQDAKESQKFMAATDPNTGKSRKQSMREALYEAALHPTEKSLGACVKAIEFFEAESGHTKLKGEMLSDKSHIVPVLKIVINSPILMNPEIIDGDNPTPAKTQPSFAATEPAQAPYIDGEIVQQNRGPKPKKPTGRKPYEEFSPEPVPAPKPEPAHVPNALDILEARRADALKRGPQR